MPYRPELDGLRALCILFTVAGHVLPVPAFLDGGVGVDVFFALSGYLITTLLARELQGDGSVCLGCFYLRRLFRIVPLYYFVILLYVAAAIATSGMHGGTGHKLDAMLAAWPYLISFMSEYRPEAAGWFFGHAWTLGIEEKYYLAWPLLFLALQRLRQRDRLLLIGIAVVVGAFVLRADLFRGYGGLALGSMLAIALDKDESRVGRGILAIPPWLCVAGMALAYGITVLAQTEREHILVAVAACPLLASVLHRRSVVAQVLAWRPLVAVGRLTYAIYLIHILAANALIAALGSRFTEASWALRVLLTYGLAVLLAIALKRAIEDPMIAVGRRVANSLRARQRLAMRVSQGGA